MNSIDIVTLFTILFVVIDDWHQEYCPPRLKRKTGRPPKFSDSEVLTLMLGRRIPALCSRQPVSRLISPPITALCSLIS